MILQLFASKDSLAEVLGEGLSGKAHVKLARLIALDLEVKSASADKKC